MVKNSTPHATLQQNTTHQDETCTSACLIAMYYLLYLRLGESWDCSPSSASGSRSAKCPSVGPPSRNPETPCRSDAGTWVYLAIPSSLWGSGCLGGGWSILGSPENVALSGGPEHVPHVFPAAWRGAHSTLPPTPLGEREREMESCVEVAVSVQPLWKACGRKDGKLDWAPPLEP